MKYITYITGTPLSPEEHVLSGQSRGNPICMRYSCPYLFLRDHSSAEPRLMALAQVSIVLYIGLLLDVISYHEEIEGKKMNFTRSG